LREVTETQAEWAYKREFDNYAWKTKHKAVCFECGHGWDCETNLISILTLECPKCNKKLKIAETRGWRRTEWSAFDIVITIKDYQVIRTVQIFKYSTKGIPARFCYHEIYQHWIHKNGKHSILSTGFNGRGYFQTGQGWNWHGPMELRSNHHNRYYLEPDSIWPRTKYLPEIIRNGFEGEFHGMHKSVFFSYLLGIPMFETFLKMKQFPLLAMVNTYNPEIIDRYWLQIRICMKNDYIIRDPRSYTDYLKLAQRFKMNIQDPKVICPKNFSRAHDALVKRKRDIDEANTRAEKEKRDQENKEFMKAKKKLMHLEFTDGKIKIVTLKNVMDYKNEERILDHCVYSSDYHKKNASLIMSARIGNRRLETIEISLSSFTILQCRGFNNKDSKYHEQIMALMEKNLRHVKIAFCKDPKKEKPSLSKVA